MVTNKRIVMDEKIGGLALIITSVVILSSTQILIKSRLNVHGIFPLDGGAFSYLIEVCSDWRLWMAALGLIAASLCWYAAISRLPLSVAFPFAAMSYPAVLLGSALFLNEFISWKIVVGNALIVLGIFMVAMATR